MQIIERKKLTVCVDFINALYSVNILHTHIREIWICSKSKIRVSHQMQISQAKGFLLHKKCLNPCKKIILNQHNSYIQIEIVWINFLCFITLKEHQNAIKYQFTQTLVRPRKLFPPLYSRSTISNRVLFVTSNDEIWDLMRLVWAEVKIFKVIIATIAKNPQTVFNKSYTAPLC